MEELQLIRDWYMYNFGVRKKYWETLCTLPDAELFRDRGASFPTILDIYTHVLDAYRWWFVYVYNDRLSGYHRLSGKNLSLKQIQDEETMVNTTVMNMLGSINPEQLDMEIVYSNPWAKCKESIQLRHMLWHMVEEELQHRGELNALLWQIDVDPPIIGWDDWWSRRQ